MIAEASDYLYSWQLIPILALAAGWIMGGGFLLRKSALKQGLSKVRGNFCSLVMVLSLLAAGVLVFIILMASSKLSESLDVNFFIPGFVLAMILSIAFFILIVYAMLDMSLKQAVRTAIPPLAAMIIVTSVILAVAIPITNSQTKTRRGINNCIIATSRLANTFRFFSRPSDLPPTLEALKESDYRFSIVCPANHQPGSYFYLRPKELPATNQLILCDAGDNHNGQGRCVILFKNGTWENQWLSENLFQELLQLPANKTFREALEKSQNPHQ